MGKRVPNVKNYKKGPLSILEVFNRTGRINQ
jgi:hypothetical protein